jgi:hypothetical protein
MSHFDRLETGDPPVVHPRSGTLTRVMDDHVRGVPIANALQDMVVKGDDSEDYAGLYGEEEKDEFIHRLLGHWVVGGAMVRGLYMLYIYICNM